MNPQDRIIFDKLIIEVQELRQWKRDMSASKSIPLVNDQAIRRRFLGKGLLVPTGLGSAGSQSVFSSFDVTVPANPTGTLKVVFNGTTYELLHK